MEHDFDEVSRQRKRIGVSVGSVELLRRQGGGTHVEAKEEYVIGVLLKQRLRVVVAYLYSSSSSSFHFLSFPL